MTKFSFQWKVDTLVCICLAHHLGLAVVVLRRSSGLGKEGSGCTHKFSGVIEKQTEAEGH